MNRVEFFVPGSAKPGGSKRSFRHKHTGKIVTIDAADNKVWRATVAQIASYTIKKPFTGPLRVTFDFSILRPRHHYGTGSNSDNIRQSAPKYPTKRPDLTKLIRSTEDACTGIVWRDDAQIVSQHANKEYVDSWPGVLITVWEIQEKIGDDQKRREFKSVRSYSKGDRWIRYPRT